MAELVYNVTEAAAALGISRRSMYDLMHQKDFPSVKLNGRTVVVKSMLATWLEQQVKEQKEGAALVLAHQDGKAEQTLTGPVSASTISEKWR